MLSGRTLALAKRTHVFSSVLVSQQRFLSIPSLEALQKLLANLAVRVGRAEVKITEEGVKIDGLETRAGTLKTKVEDLQAEVFPLEGSVASLRSKVDALSADVPKLHQTVGDIAKTVKTTASTVDRLVQEAPQLKETVENIETSVKAMRPAVDSLAIEVPTLQNTVAEMVVNVATMRSKTDLLNVSIPAMQRQITGLILTTGALLVGVVSLSAYYYLHIEPKTDFLLSKKADLEAMLDKKKDLDAMLAHEPELYALLSKKEEHEALCRELKAYLAEIKPITDARNDAKKKKQKILDAIPGQKESVRKKYDDSFPLLPAWRIFSALGISRAYAHKKKLEALDAVEHDLKKQDGCIPGSIEELRNAYLYYPEQKDRDFVTQCLESTP